MNYDEIYMAITAIIAGFIFRRINNVNIKLQRRHMFIRIYVFFIAIIMLFSYRFVFDIGI